MPAENRRINNETTSRRRECCKIRNSIIYFSNSLKELLNNLKRPIDDSNFEFDSEPEEPDVTSITKAKRIKAITTTPATQRFRWKNEMVQSLLDFICEIKSHYENKGLDFEADLVRLYKEIRVKMAERYLTGEFGPVSVSEFDVDLPHENVLK